jgi:hypothetical protein
MADLPPPPPPPAGVVKTGMAYDDVKRAKGNPQRTFTRSGMVIFDYGDHEVIFTQDKVQDIRWK